MADYFFHYFLFLFLFITGRLGVEGSNDGCKITKCGENGPPIRFPFQLRPNQPKHCGYPGFELSCNHMKQTVLELPVALEVVVDKIDYISQSIYVHDPHNCFPAQAPRLNLSASPFNFLRLPVQIALFNCSPAERNIPTLVPCLSGPGYQIYAAESLGSLTEELTNCVKIRDFSFSTFGFSKHPQRDLQLSWRKPSCRLCESKDKMCRWKNYNTTTAAAAAAAGEPELLECVQMPKKPTDASKIFHLAVAARKPLFIVLGAIFLCPVIITLYQIYNSFKRKKEDQVKVKRFLEDYKALKPSRYSFADIKKITNKFKDKLGEGSYGTVFKGKLSSKIFVAVKVLESSMENGKEFINEVGAMGLIHHVNVVRLVGFCADGINRALIYEFLPNRSLEKLIFSETQNKTFLGWERLRDIALGIARGIEYLHQGCEHQILHFDIKPHNILLDNNFNPKIADFGQAKLCPKDQSKVSMTAARGTKGYIAPEVFSRNFGNVSHKSDVYSFGMLLLEMVGGRKKIDLTVQNPSQMSFPELIYDRLCRREEMGIKIEEEEDAEIAKKLTIVGLCCIQWSPLDRPPMKTVVQMLEGKGDILAMPLNPFASIGRHESSNKPARAFNIELVYESRHLFGEILTTESPTDCNVVIAVLDFGVVAALGYAAKAGMASTTNTNNRRNTP
ncbi:hypothetical protein LguiB_013303 [Lonicera macranthoides]